MRIIVSIDRLVLDDVGHHDLARLQAALELELTQALTDRAPSPQRGGATRAADAPIDVSRGPEAIGQAIARAAHARIAEAGVGPRSAALARPAAAQSMPTLNAGARP